MFLCICGQYPLCREDQLHKQLVTYMLGILVVHEVSRSLVLYVVRVRGNFSAVLCAHDWLIRRNLVSWGMPEVPSVCNHGHLAPWDKLQCDPMHAMKISTRRALPSVGELHRTTHAWAWAMCQLKNIIDYHPNPQQVFGDWVLSMLSIPAPTVSRFLVT